MNKNSERIVSVDKLLDIQDSGKACAYFKDRACNDKCVAFTKRQGRFSSQINPGCKEFQFYVVCGRGNFEILTHIVARNNCYGNLEKCQGAQDCYYVQSCAVASK